MPRTLCRLRPSNTETAANFAAGSSLASPVRSSPSLCPLDFSARPRPPSCQLCLVPSPSTSLVAIYCWTRHPATNSVTVTLPPYCWQELSPCSKSRLLLVYALSHATSDTVLFVGIEACPHARGDTRGGETDGGPELRGSCAGDRRPDTCHCYFRHCCGWFLIAFVLYFREEKPEQPSTTPVFEISAKNFRTRPLSQKALIVGTQQAVGIEY